MVLASSVPNELRRIKDEAVAARSTDPVFRATDEPEECLVHLKGRANAQTGADTHSICARSIGLLLRKIAAVDHQLDARHVAGLVRLTLGLPCAINA